MRFAAVAHDPGGANAVAAVVATLRGAGDEVAAFAKGPAARQFQQLGVAHEVVDQDHDAVVANLDAEVLIAGTSAEDAFELDAIATATARGLPTIALVDYWANYHQRFVPRGETRGALCLPDVITAPDAHAARDMVRDGLPAARIRVTGQPYFGWLLRREREGFPPREPEARPRLRLLFASEPGLLAGVALDWLAHALGQLEARATLSVRFHPRENDRAPVLGRLWRSGIHAGIDENPDALASVLAADAVFGLTSTLLVEAALLGRPTASILPSGQDPLARIRPDFIAALRSTTEVHAYLTPLGNFPSPSPRAALRAEQRGADSRVAKLCRALGASTHTERIAR